jgi:hypothetical protein
MTKQIIQLKIDVSKISKDRLYKGKKGTYLTAALILNEGTDEYGNDGMIIEQISKEEREAGHKGTILGNAKILKKSEPVVSAVQTVEAEEIFGNDLPF